MIPFLLSLARPNQQEKPNKEVDLQEENAPRFRGDLEEERFDLNERYLNKFYEINTTKGERATREFYHCELVLDNVMLAESYAFGTGLSVSAGGGIFVSSTAFTFTSGSITNCSAGTGGSIAGIDCVMFISDSTFSGSTAYKFAGAIYTSSIVEIKIDGISINRYQIPDAKCYITNCTFENNKAQELAGALFIQLFSTMYIGFTAFINNHAGHSGGAVLASKCDPHFYRCNFHSNSAGNRIQFFSLFSASESNKNRFFMTNERKNHREGFVRSGGAISFNAIKLSSDDHIHFPFPSNHPQNPPRNNDLPYQMITQDCCFGGNSVIYMSGLKHPGGQDVHIAGNVVYHSYEDYFAQQDVQSSISISREFEKNGKATYLFIGKLQDRWPQCPGTPGKMPVPTTAPEEYPKAKDSTDYSVIVPLPTLFTYQQTPLVGKDRGWGNDQKYTHELECRTFELKTPSDFTPAEIGAQIRGEAIPGDALGLDMTRPPELVEVPFKSSLAIVLGMSLLMTRYFEMF